MIKLAVLPGDGIGDEVMSGPMELLRVLSRDGVVEVSGPWPVGATAYAATGQLLPSHTVAACEDADAILLGAVGDHPGVALNGIRPEVALLTLREHFDLRISVRRVWQDGASRLVIIRNLLAGAYGDPRTRHESDGTGDAQDDLVLSEAQVRELVEMACAYMDAHPGWSVVSVDKANLLATSRLWRRVATRVFAEREVAARHVHVDRCAFEIAHDDLVHTIVVTEGLFGDILSDVAAGRAGSIALCSSASVHPGAPARGRCVGLFEPVHGSAPRHAGAQRANPTGTYLALADALEWFPQTAWFGARLRVALSRAMQDGPRTYDLAPRGEPQSSTAQFATRVNEHFFSDME